MALHWATLSSIEVIRAARGRPLFRQHWNKQAVSSRYRVRTGAFGPEEERDEEVQAQP